MKKNIFFLLNFFSYAYCLADELNLEDEEIKNALSQNVYEPNYFSLFLGLFLVVGLIYLTGFLYQKLSKVRINTENDFVNKPQVLATTSLGQGKNIHVIKINDDYILVGATQNNISFLKDLDKNYIIEQLRKVDENS